MNDLNISGKNHPLLFLNKNIKVKVGERFIQEDKMESYRKNIERLFIGIVFISLLVFFTKIHPIVLFDTDDWKYSYYHRTALPLWKKWNPIRVFPEIFMPAVSMIGRYVLNSFIKDYFFSLTLSYALAVSSVFTIFLWILYRQFNEPKISVLLVAFFIISHFWIFRSSFEGNDYMLRTIDACTHFYYVIPNILNCSAVLCMIKRDNWKKISDESYERKSVYVILLYFCIFSNLWASVILASYIGSILLYDFLVEIRKKNFGFASFSKGHILYLQIIIIWFVSQIFEVKGGRAASVSSGPYLENVMLSIRTVISVLERMNKAFLVSTLIVLILGTVLMIRNKDRYCKKIVMSIAVSFFLMSLYLILSCAKAGSSYLNRPDVFYGCFFFFMLIVLWCMYEILQEIPKLKIIAPLLLIIALVECNTSGRTFRESTIRQIPPEVCVNINNDIMQQFIEAETEGKKEIIVYVPFFESAYNDNWPIATYATDTLAEHFYKMRIIKTKIKVLEIVPTIEKNKELHVN